jgi:hypothetical protein
MQVTTEQYQVKFIIVHPRTGDRKAVKWRFCQPDKAVLMNRLALVYPEYRLTSFAWSQIS